MQFADEFQSICDANSDFRGEYEEFYSNFRDFLENGLRSISSKDVIVSTGDDSSLKFSINVLPSSSGRFSCGNVFGKLEMINPFAIRFNLSSNFYGFSFSFESSLSSFFLLYLTFDNSGFVNSKLGSCEFPYLLNVFSDSFLTQKGQEEFFSFIDNLLCLYCDTNSMLDTFVLIDLDDKQSLVGFEEQFLRRIKEGY